MPYGLIGKVGSPSAIGIFSGVPYVAALDEKMKCGTPSTIALSISARLAAVLLR
jgi:hypothetical protein